MDKPPSQRGHKHEIGGISVITRTHVTASNYFEAFGWDSLGDIEENILAMAKRTEFLLAFDPASNFGRDGEIMK